MIFKQIGIRSRPLFFAALLLSLGVSPPPHGLAAEGLTLNLKDADLRTFINTVAEVTGKNFLVEPSVKGKITVYSGRPLDGDALYQVLLSILEVHGFTAVTSGKLIKIVPAGGAKNRPVPVDGGESTENSDQIVTRIFELQHTDPAKISPLLQPLMSPNAHVFAFPNGTSLIVSEYASNLERFAKIIQRLDKPQSAEIETVPLQNASAAELAPVLTNLLNADKRRLDTPNPPFIVADPRTNSLFIGGSREDRMHLTAMATGMDTPQKFTGNTRVVYLHHAKARDLVPVLTGVVNDYKTQEKAISGGAMPGQAQAAPVPAAPVGSAPSAASGGMAAGQKSGSAISVSEYASGNALVITAPPDLMRSIISVIEELDVRRAQVQVEAVIAEISTDKELELGIQWRFAPSSRNSNAVLGGTNFNIGGNGINAVSQNPLAVGDGMTIGYMTGATNSLVGTTAGAAASIVNLGALIRAKAGDAINNILSTPSLVTMDNQEAKIMVGQNIPQLTGGFVAGQGGTVNPFQTYTRQDVGIILKVIPQINDGGTVQMEIEQEVSSLADVAGLSEKATNKRTIHTSVLVDDQQILVLGGLITDGSQESMQKVPLFGDIPVLGELFRYRQTKNSKTNLMVFLRPTILRDVEKGWSLTNQRYRFIRESQGRFRGDNPTQPQLPENPLESPMLIDPMRSAPTGLEKPPLDSPPKTPEPVAKESGPSLSFGAGSDVAQ